jgi:hypothetical protein
MITARPVAKELDGKMTAAATLAANFGKRQSAIGDFAAASLI